MRGELSGILRRIAVFVFVLCLGFSGTPSLALPTNPCLPGVPCTATPETHSNIQSKSESDSCDAAFMNKIYARATLEAEREIALNNALIDNRHSVLQLSCFKNDLAATPAGATLSETDAYKNKFIFPSPRPYIPTPFLIMVQDGDLSGNLDAVAKKPLEAYLDENFDPATCKNMASIWELSKCSDLDYAHFQKLENLKGNDFRGCSDDNMISDALIKEASYGSALSPSSPRETASTLASYKDHETYTSKTAARGSIGKVGGTLQPIQCTQNVPIPTGVTLSDGSEEKTCINPFCYYDAKNDKCGP